VNGRTSCKVRQLARQPAVIALFEDEIIEKKQTNSCDVDWRREQVKLMRLKIHSPFENPMKADNWASRLSAQLEVRIVV
jgi:hypothetical protein